MSAIVVVVDIEQEEGRVDPFTCGGCHTRATVLVVVCRGCGKQICADCALDDELQTLCCYVCLDSTYQGRKLRGGARRRR